MRALRAVRVGVRRRQGKDARVPCRVLCGCVSGPEAQTEAQLDDWTPTGTRAEDPWASRHRRRQATGRRRAGVNQLTKTRRPRPGTRTGFRFRFTADGVVFAHKPKAHRQRAQRAQRAQKARGDRPDSPGIHAKRPLPPPHCRLPTARYQRHTAREEAAACRRQGGEQWPQHMRARHQTRMARGSGESRHWSRGRHKVRGKGHHRTLWERPPPN